MTDDAEVCDHHGHEVELAFIKIDATNLTCSWCTDPNTVIAIIKSRRHRLILCDECAMLLGVTSEKLRSYVE